MFAWLKKLLGSAETKAKIIEQDAQKARATAMTSLDAFYSHMTGGLRKLHQEEQSVQAYWAAEFAKLHGYIAKLESAAKSKLTVVASVSPAAAPAPVKPAVVVS